MVHTLLSGPVVHTLYFPKEMVYTLVLFAL